MITDETKEKIKKLLTEGKVVVEFTKLDGNYRKMTCTLQEGVVPAATKNDSVTQKRVREISPEVCVVYDVNAQGWRSFRWDSVINATFDELS